MAIRLTALKDKTQDIDGLLFNLLANQIINFDRYDSLVSAELLGYEAKGLIIVIIDNTIDKHLKFPLVYPSFNRLNNL